MTHQKTPTPADASTKVSKTARLTQRELEYQNPQTRIPIEVWQGVCGYLYPSQLIRLSKVSSLLHRTVVTLPVWAKLFARTHDEKSRLHYVPGIPDSQSYMYFMVAISPKICEQCFKHCSFETDRPSTFPLLTVAPSQTRSTTEITYHGEPIDKGFTVRLCVECRRAFFMIKPEPIPKDLVKKMDGLSNMTNRYPHVFEVPSIRDGGYHNNATFSEVIFFKAAKVLHGGDIGIAASRQTTDAQQTMIEHRLEQYVSSNL